MARFSVTQVPEAIQPLWTALQAGEFVADAYITDWLTVRSDAAIVNPHIAEQVGPGWESALDTLVAVGW